MRKMVPPTLALSNTRSNLAWWQGCDQDVKTLTYMDCKDSTLRNIQWEGGRRISPMAYAAFDDDADNARRNHDAWLAAAKEAARKLLPAG